MPKKLLAADTTSARPPLSAPCVRMTTMNSSKSISPVASGSASCTICETSAILRMTPGWQASVKATVSQTHNAMSRQWGLAVRVMASTAHDTSGSAWDVAA